MKIGILGAADIAFRRFLPALEKCADLAYAGVASRPGGRGQLFQKRYGGAVYNSYEALLDDESIQAVYVPLPPALHFPWGRRALEYGKHLLMEKPFAACQAEAEKLLELAKGRGLAVHENYMFLYHAQMVFVKEAIASGELGEVRLFRMAFGFPRRAETDFRYSRALGGGALLDCGGYPIRLALELLGSTARVTQARLLRPRESEVDVCGSAVLENDAGMCAQISFGMDNAYQNCLEIWGSKATLIAPRIFTAGPDFAPQIIMRGSREERQLHLPADDHFLHSIERFMKSINDKHSSEEICKNIVLQAKLQSRIRGIENENN